MGTYTGNTKVDFETLNKEIETLQRGLGIASRRIEDLEKFQNAAIGLIDDNSFEIAGIKEAVRKLQE